MKEIQRRDPLSYVAKILTGSKNAVEALEILKEKLKIYPNHLLYSLFYGN